MTTTAKSAKTKKVTKGSKAKLDAKNEKQIAYRITHEKELKYIYPAEMEAGKNKKEVLAKRKKFRAEVRRKTRSLEKALKLAKKGKDPVEIKKAQRALDSYMKATYSPAE